MKILISKQMEQQALNRSPLPHSTASITRSKAVTARSQQLLPSLLMTSTALESRWDSTPRAA